MHAQTESSCFCFVIWKLRSLGCNCSYSIDPRVLFLNAHLPQKRPT